MLLDLFMKTRYTSMKIKPQEAASDINAIATCKKCGILLNRKEYLISLAICPSCGSYGRISSDMRIYQIANRNSFEELFSEITSANPLDFEGYEEKIDDLKAATGLNEAVVTGHCYIAKYHVALGIMDHRFLMASMGSAVGEKLSRLFNYATQNNLPVVLFIASGGARMHEGIFSLMQMAKISSAVLRHSQRGLLYVPILTDPTMGGVTASFAMQGDIILAESGSCIGFAGRRVIEGTISQKLPQEFQSAEFLLKKGFVDKIVDRKETKKILVNILSLHQSVEKEVCE